MILSDEHIDSSLSAALSDGTPNDVIKRYSLLTSQAAESDYGEFDHNIVVLDTETTGFSLNHDELIQIAAARIEQGEIVDVFNTFVNPGKPIPDTIVHLTGIHDEDVNEAPSPSEALTALVEFIGNAKIVAHNVEFDLNFTTKHPSGYPLLENLWIDSLDLARIAVPRLKSHRLIDLVHAFGAPVSTHRADDDVAATCVVYRILLAAVAAMPKVLLEAIASMATPEQWSTVAVFSHFARKQSTKQNQREAKVGERSKYPLRMYALRSKRLHAIESSPKTDADVLAANPKRGLQYPTQEVIEKAFSYDGLMASLYTDFESREEQRLMAESVRKAYTTSQNLVVEAGTGVGKSMAYLIPSVLLALENDITVGIATKTNSLLDQLLFHELPSLAKMVEQQYQKPLMYTSLKGYTHYPCLRKVDRLVADGPVQRIVANKEYSQAPSLAALLSYIEQTEYDDMDGLKIDYRVLPRRTITTTSHECLHRKCPYFGSMCFIHGSRRMAEASHIVVTNHSLLFCDLAAEGGLLPPIRFWVVDEAHSAEREARQAFSLELSSEDLIHLAGRVASKEASRNIFIRAERTVVIPYQEEQMTLFFMLTQKAKAAGEVFSQVVDVFLPTLKGLLFFVEGKQNKGYENIELWINEDIRSSYTFAAVRDAGQRLSDAAEKLVTLCQELIGYLEERENAAVVQREIATIAIDLKKVIQTCDVILFKPQDTYVYAAQLNRKKDKFTDTLEALPFNVGQTLKELFYARTHSVIYTSATLSVNGSFTAFEQSMGLNGDESSRSISLQLDSSYDYDHQMTVYVVRDMPEPNDSRYLAELQRLLIHTHRAQQGSMLTLFTNRKEMEQCFAVVEPALKENDLRVVCQKWGVSIKGLKDDFLKDEHLSLFALKSFWEGFDAPGATLKGVIIPKLPFAKPTDPLSCERAARDDQAWRKYVLPAAVIETKQAAGRLIRKAEDRGVLILADKRLISKNYGKIFLNSLPSHTVKLRTIDEIVSDLEVAFQFAK